MAEMLKKLLAVKASEVKDNVVRFVASTSDVDRDGDIIEAKGWDLDNWKKNPVHLWGHSHRAPPIGQGVNSEITDDALIIETEFAAKGIDYDDWPSTSPSPETVVG